MNLVLRIKKSTNSKHCGLHRYITMCKSIKKNIQWQNYSGKNALFYYRFILVITFNIYSTQPCVEQLNLIAISLKNLKILEVHLKNEK